MTVTNHYDEDPDLYLTPDTDIDAGAVFGLSRALTVKGFAKPLPHTPNIDPDYVFDPETTEAILSGFQHNRRVMLSGMHGTGKSTHIEQVAARLNWPCIRINLDSHVSRVDLVGKDAIVLENGKQVTTFKDGMLPWALKRNIALVFDEYDAGRPDVMFVIQRVLEMQGRLTLLDQNKVIEPHTGFRLFATSNTVGLGDTTGLYHGTQQINQGQMDRWSVVAILNYLDEAVEIDIVTSKIRRIDSKADRSKIQAMVQLATMTREAFKANKISTLMSPRTVITWAENAKIFNNDALAFRFSFLNRCDREESLQIAEMYQRAMGEELPESALEQLTG